ncbi:hypothetical protein [Paenibacillus chitinolyticus]|uniref:hypothetical protein n=1 Tax=Paenibacillus chitinolyticus TaxID=79263 RepID=UPI003D01BE20
MLQKRIDLGSQPFGLAIAGEDIVKGSAVIVKNDKGVLKAFYPATASEADGVKGFATYRIETQEGSDKEHDLIKKGTRLVVYTLVKDNMWATTQFVGTPAQDAKLVVGYEAADKGKLREKKATGEDARPALFTVYEVNSAGSGYTDSMIEVFVL